MLMPVDRHPVDNTDPRHIQFYSTYFRNLRTYFRRRTISCLEGNFSSQTEVKLKQLKKKVSAQENTWVKSAFLEPVFVTIISKKMRLFLSCTFINEGREICQEVTK
jgi:hypothetical protein